MSASYFTVDPAINGVEYNYYDGSWVLLPDLSILAPSKSGRIYDIGLGEVPRRWGASALQFKCFLDITQDGDYTLSLASDDRTRVFLDDKQLIDFDGVHGIADARGKANLVRGKHKLEVRYFRQGSPQDFTIFIEGPGMSRQPLPPRLLTIR